ncbi:MAG: type II secretion system protein GspJ [Planctomycetota bacterium]|nr:type II secretion system protein GspJ [Planctomycetota bacterium]
MNSRREKRAFTLLEMLVATAMTAVLAGSLYATLHVAFRARRSASESIEPVRKTQLALELLRADIQSAVVPKGVMAGSFLGENRTDDSGRDCDSLLLHCTGAGPSQPQQSGDIRMIELSCEPVDVGAGQILVRRITPNPLATDIDETPQEVLCRGVHAFNLRYFDGEQWQDSWDSATRDNLLPLAVEVTLQLQSEQEAKQDDGGYCASGVFLIPCSSPASGTTQ